MAATRMPPCVNSPTGNGAMTDHNNSGDLAEARRRIARHVQQRMDRLGITLTEIHRRTAAMEGDLCGCPHCEGEGTTKHPDIPTRGVSTRTLTRFVNPEQEPGWRPRSDTTVPTSEALGWPADAIDRMFEQPSYRPPPDAPDWTPTDRARLDRLEARVESVEEAVERLAQTTEVLSRLRDVMLDQRGDG